MKSYCIFLLMFGLISNIRIVIAQKIDIPFSVRYFPTTPTNGELIQSIQAKKLAGGNHYPSRELTVTNTGAFVNHYVTERQRKINPIGAKFHSHNIYYDAQSHINYFQSSPLGLRNYLVVDSFPQKQFDLVKDSIVIMGYACYKAIEVNPDQRKKIIYWYAPSLPYPYGPEGFTGLPGLTLAVDYISTIQRRSALIAHLIEPEKREIRTPLKGKLIQKKNFYELLNNGRPM